jgi:hypothetical protein
LSAAATAAPPEPPPAEKPAPEAPAKPEGDAKEPSASPPRAERGKSRVRTYSYGVRIDWDTPAVEVDAAVVLQQGQLELLACTPQTREHESILVVPSRPRHIFEAMGLIGLEPGAPLTYDEKADRWLPARGHALTLEVRYEDKGRPRTVPVEDWMFDITKDRPVEAIDWVFAGAMVNAEGEFAADMEGTIACVVDFPSALIAVGALHSSDDSALWLAANTKRIPPQGTRCTLIIRARDGGDVPIAVSPQGALVFGGEVVTAGEVVVLLKRRATAERKPAVVLHGEKDVDQAKLAQAAKELQSAGIEAGRIRFATVAPRPAAPVKAPEPTNPPKTKSGDGD